VITGDTRKSRNSSANNMHLLHEKKRIIVSFLCYLLLCSFYSGNAQTGRYPVKKIYTYTQSKVEGVNNPRNQNTRKQTFYRIYLELWSNQKIEITHLWIQSKSCGFQTQTVTSPVKLSSDTTTFLVPSSSGEVMEVLKEAESESGTASFKKCPSRYRRFPVLIRYRQNGKIYYLGSFPKTLPKVYME